MASGEGVERTGGGRGGGVARRGRKHWVALAALAISGAVVLPVLTLHSCGAARVITDFPPGLEVREASRATWPEAAGSENPPEALMLAKGEDEGVYWAHGRAYVHAPIDAVVRALQDPDVTVSRRSVDAWTTERDVEADYPVSYRTRNVVHALITVDYDVTWRQGAREEDGVVTSYVANYQKTEGTQYITLMRGWVKAERVSDGITAVELVSELQAMRTGPDDVASYVSDLYDSVVASAHGRPLPTWDE